MQRLTLLAAAMAAVVAGQAGATPFVPTDDTVVLERLPEGQDVGLRELRALHARLARTPDDLPLAVDVAGRDIAQARRAADPRWLGRAEAALAPWPVGPDAPPETTLLHATILQSNHDFAASLAALGLVLRARPGDRQALLVRAAVSLVQADYPAARRDCGAVAATTAGLVPATCVAGVMAMTGHAPAALRALTLAQAQAADEAPATRLWAATLAAEIAARLGDPSAEARFEAARAIDPNDPYLLAAFADWLLDAGRAAEVVTLLERRTRIDPLLLRLAIAERDLGLPAAATHTDELAARFETLRARGDTVHRREQARFALDLRGDAAEALALARANWDVQREPADARILLRAARAAGAPEAATPVLDWLRANAVEDAALTRLAATLVTRS